MAPFIQSMIIQVTDGRTSNLNLIRIQQDDAQNHKFVIKGANKV